MPVEVFRLVVVKIGCSVSVTIGCLVSVTICCLVAVKVYQHLKSGQLVEVLEHYPLISDTAIWAVYPSSRQVAPKVRAFIDYLVEYYGEPTYWDKY